MDKSHNPEKNLKLASSLLLIKALILICVPVVLMVMDWGGADRFGHIMAISLAAVGGYVLTAAILVRRKKKVGRVLAWVVLPIFALGFPIGTILSVATMYNLEQGKTILN